MPTEAEQRYARARASTPYNPDEPYAVPVAVLADSDVDAWLVGPTRLCATGSASQAPRGYTTRFDLSSGDNDPKILIPQPACAGRLWGNPMLWESDRPPHNWCGFHLVVVNRLATPLILTLETGDVIHGWESVYPSKRSWDAPHKRHRWDKKTGSYTVPPGNRARGLSGVGLWGVDFNPDAYRGAGAVLCITPDPSETALGTPLWFGGYSGYVWQDGRYLGVALTDDPDAYKSDPSNFFQKELQDRRTNVASCGFSKGTDTLHPEAGYSASVYMAMLDPAPPGQQGDLSRGTYLGWRKQLSYAQAVLVIEPAGS